MTLKQTNRFLSKIEKLATEAGCWLWSDAPNSSDPLYAYGRFGMNGKVLGAHRVSFEFHTGQHPGNLKVLHRCDTPCCVNPEHLFLGTQEDNMRDMIRKGRKRTASGMRHGSKTHPHRVPMGESKSQSKLTSAIVREVRNLHENGSATMRSIAIKFNVHANTIQDILAGRTWKHVV